MPPPRGDREAPIPSDSATAAAGGTSRLTPPRVGGVAGLLAGCVVLAPWLVPGALLVRDLVAVPDPAWASHLLTGGLRVARDVPGEVLAALVGQVLGGDLVVRLALLGACVALGAGIGRLLRDAPPAAAAVAAVAAVVSPWTWAYLRAGQWLVVVALAVVPWVADAVARDDRILLVRALVVGAATGFLAAVVVWPTLVVVGVVARRWRATALGLATAVVGALPWLLLRAPSSADPDGFAAFAANADVPLGTWAALLAGGGYFNAAIASPWRDMLVLGTLATLLAVAAAGSAVAAAWWREGGRPALQGLVVVGGVGVLVAGLGATGPGLRALAATARVVPATAVLRDTHRLLAPWVVVLAVGVGLLVARLIRHHGGAWQVAAIAVLLVVLALPDPVVGPRLPGTTTLPAAWGDAARMVDDDPRPGVVLVVPHGQTQRYAFTDDRPVAVPLRRLVARPVAVSTDLRVGDLVVGEDDGQGPWARLAARPPARWDAAAFADAGVAWVAVTDPDRLTPTPPAGFERVVDDPTLVLLRVTGSPTPVDVAAAPWLVGLDGLLLALGVGVLARPRRRCPGRGSPAPDSVADQPRQAPDPG